MEANFQPAGGAACFGRHLSIDADNRSALRDGLLRCNTAKVLLRAPTSIVKRGAEPPMCLSRVVGSITMLGAELVEQTLVIRREFDMVHFVVRELDEPKSS
jgi:hypothetical protein